MFVENRFSAVDYDEKTAQKGDQPEFTTIKKAKGKKPKTQNSDAEDIFASFTQNIHNLQPGFQTSFEKFMDRKLGEIAAFQCVFQTNNRRFLGEKNLSRAEIRDKFLALREKEKTQFQSHFEDYEKCAQIFGERIKVLQKAIAQLNLESSFLQQCITGNDSYFNSFSLIKLEMGYRYGANFRLWEINSALEARKAAIGINDKESATATAEVALVTPSSLDFNTLTQISSDIDELKEEVIISNEAFKSATAELVDNSELSKKFYVFHKQRLNAIETQIAGIQKEKKIENRKKALEAAIKVESSSPNSPKSLALKQELAQLDLLINRILQRQEEIKALLLVRRQICKLTEKEENIQGEPPSANLIGTTFGATCERALDLTKRITASKEKILIGNQTESIATLEQRKRIYKQLTEENEGLKKQKEAFEKTELSKRSEMINAAVATYMSYITSIQETMSSMNGHIKLLTTQTAERADWDKLEKLPAPPSTSSQTTTTQSTIAQTTTTTTTSTAPPSTTTPAATSASTSAQATTTPATTSASNSTATATYASKAEMKN